MLSVKHEPRGSLLVQTVHDALARMAHLESKNPLKTNGIINLSELIESSVTWKKGVEGG